MPRRYKPDTPRMPSEPSLGGLDAYPLRRSSAICKATGGGRWEPKQIQQHPGHRLPGGKAPFEIEMEREEEEERLRRLNPIVRDGGSFVSLVAVIDRLFMSTLQSFNIGSHASLNPQQLQTGITYRLFNESLVCCFWKFVSYFY